MVESTSIDLPSRQPNLPKTYSVFEKEESFLPTSREAGSAGNVAIVAGVGGAGSTTLCHHLSQALSHHNFEVTESTRTSFELDQSTVFVASANQRGAKAIDRHILQRAEIVSDATGQTDIDVKRLAGLVVVAVEDGLAGQRIPRDVRVSLKTVQEVVPVVVLPRVRHWREDVDHKPTRAYSKKIQEIAAAVLKGIDKEIR